MTFLFVLGLVTLILYIVQGIEVTIGGRRLRHLEDIPPIADDRAPSISVIIPACNEELGIEQALRSVLALDYPRFEVIVVEDRSADRTGEILDRMARENPVFRVVHIKELPPAWLGKNHALQQGAQLASGDLLLFTDADVVMEPSVLRRAATFLESDKLDHLAAVPRATVPGFWSNAFLGVFALGFSLYVKPWRVKDPKSVKHIGIGAFNLLRRSAYFAAGGHGPIAMRPDDDMMLGKLLKQRGFRQDMAFATKLLTVAWYGSFRELQGGLMKNLFAAARYSVSVIALGVIFQFGLLVWPWVALVVCRGPVQAVNALAVLALCVLFWLNAGLVGFSGWWCFSVPVGALISIYLLVRSTILTLANGGIRWRGTHYPLDLLRSNKL